MANRKRALRIAQTVVGVVLLLILVLRVDTTRLAEALSSIAPGPCCLGFLFFGAVGALEILRLYVVFRRYPVSLATTAHLYFAGMFFANFIPTAFGAEVYKVHLLRRLENDVARPIALLLLVRLSGLALLLAAVGVYTVFAYPRLEANVTAVTRGARIDVGTIMIAGGLSLVAALVTLALPAGRRLLSRSRPPLRAAWEAVREIRGVRAALLIFLGIVIWASRVGAIYWFVHAFTDPRPYVDLLPVVALANLAALLPVSFAGLGVREATLMLGLAVLGISPSHGLGVALLSRAALWAVSLIGALLYLLKSRAVSHEFGD